MAHHLGIFLVAMLFISQRTTASSEYVSSPETSTLESFSSVTVDAVIDHIFEKYSADYVMSFEGYEHLLESLSLGVIEIDHSLETHVRNPSKKFVEFHKDHKHPLKTHQTDTHTDHSKSHHKLVQDHDHKHGHNHNNKHNEVQTNERDIKDKHTGDHDQKNDCNIKDKHDHDHTQDHGIKDKHIDDHDQTRDQDHPHQHNPKDNYTDSHDKQNDHGRTDDQDFRDIHIDTHENDNLGEDSIHDESSTSNSSKEGDYIRFNRNRRNVGQQHAGILPESLLSTCLKPMDLLQLLSFSGQGLTKTQFRDLCPLLIIQLDEHHCEHLRYQDHTDMKGHEENLPETSITPESEYDNVIKYFSD